MGILSSFCVVTLAFAVDRLVFPDATKVPGFKPWETAFVYCSIGLTSLFLSAFSFYKQRALLAYYYGQISLQTGLNSRGKTRELLLAADSWQSWIWYQAGFGFLFVAVSELGLTLLSINSAYIKEHQNTLAIAVALLFIFLYAPRIYSYWRYPNEERPLRKFFHCKLNPFEASTGCS